MLKIILIILSFSTTQSFANENFHLAYASSLLPVMKDITNSFNEDFDVDIRHSFGSSGTIARQIRMGAPYDLFISANKKWIESLDEEKLLISQKKWLSNELSLVSTKNVVLNNFNLNKNERFCIADPNFASLGIHSMEALSYYNISIPQKNLILLKDASSLNMNILLGECDHAIIFANSNKQFEDKYVVSAVPNIAYQEISYILGRISNDRINDKFINYLFSDSAEKQLLNHGFIINR